MKRAIIGPGKYIQGPGEMDNLVSYAKVYAKKLAYIIISPSMMEKYGEKIKASFEAEKFACHLEKFNRECCRSEIKRLVDDVNAKGGDLLIAVGGGKTIDTTKAVCNDTDLPVIVVPTIASTDAPCSCAAVIYTEDGIVEGVIMLKKNPEVVLVDSNVIAKAPVRLLVSGMGDALATFYECRASRRSRATTIAGGVCSESAYTLAKVCRDILFRDGLKAKYAMENNQLSVDVENIIEANTYLSGIGFESGGLAGSHAIHDGFTTLEECHKMYHGEKVAFGTIAQLVLEGAPIEEIMEVINFCKSVGLPTTLAGIGVTNPTPEKLMSVAKVACGPTTFIMNVPVTVTPETVYSAILVADKLGSK